MSDHESQAPLKQILGFLQRDKRIRVGLGVVVVAVLLGWAGKSIYDLRPRQYTLTISGGDIINNRHRLARILQQEGKKHGLTLIVKPINGALAILEQLSEHKIDLGFIPGGLDTVFPNVEHAATIQPELVHLLVKPGIHGMGDLKGHSVNLGSKTQAAREIGIKLTRFSGYTENVDFVETNYTAEQLLALPARKMPDAIISISSVPSYLVDLLVHRYHYQVVEIPFPDALALRHGWATNGNILPFTYDLNPPTPATDIRTVAVNVHLLANAETDPEAIKRLLELMYSPAVQARLPEPFDDKRIDVPSGYPVSAGMVAYMARNNSILTVEVWKRLQSLLGLLFSVSGMAVVVAKWFKGPPPKERYDDAELQARMAEVVAIEQRLLVAPVPAAEELRQMRARLGELRVQTLARSSEIKMKDPFLYDRCLLAAAEARAVVDRMLAAGPEAA